MKKPPVHVFYFRGLSTYGSDDAKWSVFNFGPMHRHLSRAFAERDVTLIPVEGMGVGRLDEMAARARKFIETHPVWTAAGSVHFCGHSAGGLIARLTLDSLADANGRVSSIMTFGTPNSGCEIARICVDMPVKFRGTTWLLLGCGYDVARHRRFFEELTPERVLPLKSLKTQGARTASVVCYSTRPDFCVPLKIFYRLGAFRSYSSLSDGIVDRDSQPFGEVVAEINIDHFRQIGLFGERKRFEKLADVLTDYFKR